VGRIPGLQKAPFNTRFNAQTTGGTGYWVGEGKPKPLTKFDFAPTILGYTKIANIAVITQEAARFSTPSLEEMVRDALAKAIIERMDIDFVDPDKAAVANVSPASITNGIVGIPSTGTTAAAFRADMATLFAAFMAGNLDPAKAVLLMPSSLAMSLGMLTNALTGQPEFPGMALEGGTYSGVPVVASQYLATMGTTGGIVVLVNAGDILLADDGGVDVDVSREASLEMSDAPTQVGSAGTGAALVSLWQNNLIGIRAERFVNWKRRRDDAVEWLDNVAYVPVVASAATVPESGGKSARKE
jgi:HK97 family phage major capsid protein